MHAYNVCMYDCGSGFSSSPSLVLDILSILHLMSGSGQLISVISQIPNLVWNLYTVKL